MRKRGGSPPLWNNHILTNSTRPALFFYLAKLVWFLLQPLVAILILGALGYLARWLRYRRTGTVLYSLAAIALGISSLSPAGLAMTAFLENRFPRPDLPPEIAGIIVLGGAFDTRVARTRGQPELNEAADRATAALALARRYPDARLLFSGGVAAVLENDISETWPAREFFLSLGLAPDRLMLDDRARDTFENALFAKELAAPKPDEVWLLITSAYHMPRAVGAFRGAGFPVLPYPVDYRTPSGPALWRPSRTTTRNLEKVHLALREYLGLLAYRLAGRTATLIPGPDP